MKWELQAIPILCLFHGHVTESFGSIGWFERENVGTEKPIGFA